MRFPWYTDALSKNWETIISTLEPSHAHFQCYINAVAEMEKQLETNVASTAFWNLRNNFQRFENGDRKLAAKACIDMLGVLDGYKIVDVIVWIFGRNTTMAPRRPHQGVFYQSFKWWNFLSNWSQTLEDFRDATRRRKQRRPLLAKDNSATNSSVPYLLLSSFINCAKMTKASAATVNLAIAGLHLTIKLTGKCDPGKLPELPTSYENWDIEGKDNLSPQDTAFLRSLFNSSSKFLRNPLELALMLSPIILLAPIQLHKKSVDSRELLKVATWLGNEKPQIIEKVEKLIWDAVFALATGRLDPEKAAEHIVDSIPWIEVQALTQHSSACDWFKGEQPKLLAVPSEHVQTPQVVDGLASMSLGTDLNCATQPNGGSSVLKERGESVDEAEESERLCDEIVNVGKIAYPHHPEPTTLVAINAEPLLPQAPMDISPRNKARHVPVPDPSSDRCNQETGTLLPLGNKMPLPTISPNSKHPLFLPDSDDDEIMFEVQGPSITETDEQNIGHIIRRALFDRKLVSEDGYTVIDNHGKSHQIWTVQCSDAARQYLDNLVKSAIPWRSSNLLTQIPVARFESMDTAEVQSLIRNKPLAISGPPTNPNFDASNLRKLHPLHGPITIHDLDGPKYYVKSLRWFEQFSTVGMQRASSISTEEISAMSMEANVPEYSSDRVAWDETLGLPGFPTDMTFPTSFMKRGVAATEGYFVNWQPSGPAGMSVCLEVKVGSQLVFINRREDVGSFEDEPGSLTSILLVAGSSIILGPTSHYAVYLTEDSIISRTYFFATSTMEDSSVAYIRHCLKYNLANDPGRRVATLLLRRLVAFYYYTLVLNFPVSEKGMAHSWTRSSSGKFRVEFDSVLGLLSLCNLMQMIHLLDKRTYIPAQEGDVEDLEGEHYESLRFDDVNCVPDKERFARAYVRAQCQEIKLWVFTEFCFHAKDDHNNIPGKTDDEMGETWLMHQMNGFIHLYGHAMKELEPPLISLSSMRSQFFWFYLETEGSNLEDITKQEVKTLSWPWSRNISVQSSGKSYVANEKDLVDFSNGGLTEPDRVYLTYLERNIQTRE